MGRSTVPPDQVYQLAIKINVFRKLTNIDQPQIPIFLACCLKKNLRQVNINIYHNIVDPTYISWMIVNPKTWGADEKNP